MEKIIIGFSKPKTWKPFSWLIMVGFNIPYDHVYLKFHSEKLSRDIIYQASSTMVNFMSANIFDANNVIIREFEVDIPSDKKLQLMQFCVDTAGTPYGVIECFGLAWVRICQLLGKTVKNPFRDGGKTYICSELASYVLEQYAGDQIPKDQDDMTPLDVYNYLLSIQKL